MVAIPEELLVPWDVGKWADDKQEAAINLSALNSRAADGNAGNSHVLEGVFLTHADPNKIYLAPHPDKLAIAIELLKSNIASVASLPDSPFDVGPGHQVPRVAITLNPAAVVFPISAVPKAKLAAFLAQIGGGQLEPPEGPFDPPDPPEPPDEPTPPKEPTCPTGIRGGVLPGINT